MQQSPSQVKRSLPQVTTPEQSPSKRRRATKDQALTPRRSSKVQATTPEKLTQGQQAADGEVPVQDSKDEFAMLPGLFFGLEFVLRLLAARGLKAYHSVVRPDVEAITGKDMNDSRLAGVLSLAGPGMIDVRWVGVGNNAKLEIFQRAEDGKAERAPTMDEHSKRKDAFNAALAVATESGIIPRRALPPRPAAPASWSSQKQSALPEAVTVKPATKGVSAVKRREALLKRVQAREAAGESVESKEYQALNRRMVICDNAMAAHSILQSLFARGEGKHSAASEEEVIKAMCSGSFSMQCRRTLNKPDAIEAVKLLAARCGCWFSIDAGKHNPDAKYFRRLLKGSSKLALEALNADREDLDNQLRALCEFVRRREEQIRSMQPLDDEGMEACEACEPQPAMDKCSKPAPMVAAVVGVPQAVAPVTCSSPTPAMVSVGQPQAAAPASASATCSKPAPKVVQEVAPAKCSKPAPKVSVVKAAQAEAPAECSKPAPTVAAKEQHAVAPATGSKPAQPVASVRMPVAVAPLLKRMPVASVRMPEAVSQVEAHVPQVVVEPPARVVEVPALQVGDAVRIHSLVKGAHLNGVLGFCKNWVIEKGRWRVHLEDGSQNNVKPDNLELQWRPPLFVGRRLRKKTQWPA